MSGTDALQAIRDAIAHLEEATAPIEDQIQGVRDDAEAQVAELEARIADQRRELTRWRRALARAEGNAADGGGAAGGRRAHDSFVISDEALTSALEGRDEGTSASEIRAALNVDVEVPAAKVTRLLGDAVSRGVVRRTGERRGTRYLPHRTQGPVQYNPRRVEPTRQVGSQGIRPPSPGIWRISGTSAWPTACGCRLERSPTNAESPALAGLSEYFPRSG